MGTGEFNTGGCNGLASHPGGRRNTASRFMLRKLAKARPDGPLGSYANVTYLPLPFSANRLNGSIFSMFTDTTTTFDTALSNRFNAGETLSTSSIKIFSQSPQANYCFLVLVTVLFKV